MATALTESFAPVEFTQNHLFWKETLNGFIERQNNHGGNNELSPKELIGNALRDRVENVDHEFCEPGEEDTFFVADLGDVYRQHIRWKKNLPRVKPFYGRSTHHTFPCLHLHLLPLLENQPS